MKTTPEQRIEMARRHAVGETYAEIAQHMQINIATVRYWCRQLRRGRSSQTHWSRGKVGILSQFAPELAATILALRQAHPGWGPDRLVDELKRRAAPGERVPSRATVGRLLHSHHQYRRPKRQRVEPVAPAPAQAVHECWEIDFKLKIGLGDGLRYNLTTVREVAGGACLYAWLSCAEQFDAQGRRTGASKHVSVDELMLCLRTVLGPFGTLPQRIQTDNETVFVGSTSDDFPGRFTLWLWGLGIEHVRTRPGVPTDNAHVERCHQTISSANPMHCRPICSSPSSAISFRSLPVPRAVTASRPLRSIPNSSNGPAPISPNSSRCSSNLHALTNNSLGGSGVAASARTARSPSAANTSTTPSATNTPASMSWSPSTRATAPSSSGPNNPMRPAHLLTKSAAFRLATSPSMTSLAPCTSTCRSFLP